MAKPMAAIVGRPNVGKSTMINRLATGRQAIVHPTPGVTRDRNYIDAEWGGRSFILIDTGGIGAAEGGDMQLSIKDQAMAAIVEADVILFLVDGKAGVVAGDEAVADIVRKSKKPVIFAANKVDNPADDSARYQFFTLGLGEPMLISAEHGIGVGDLLDKITESLPPYVEEEAPKEPGIAIVGRPNVGKSSLFNRLVGEERVVVSDIPGTTRDAIDSLVERAGQSYRFVDTAGLRKPSKLGDDIEYYGTVRAVKVLEKAEAALIVIDAAEGVTDQDQKIAAVSREKDCACMIILNKWDMVKKNGTENEVLNQVERKLSFIDWAIPVKVSALTGSGVKRIYKLIDIALDNYHLKIATSSLNRFLPVLTAGHIPSKKGKTLKLKYLTQIKSAPPSFLFFVNDPGIVDNAFKRYLEKRFRDNFQIKGTPINFYFRKERK